MYLRNKYVELKNNNVPEILSGIRTIYYVPSEKDNGKNMLGSINIEPFLFKHSISVEGILAFLALMKTFRIAGSKIKAQKYISKNGELFYNISIFGYFFAAVNCKTRKIVEIANDFKLRKDDADKLDKTEMLGVANFIKKYLFEEKYSDNIALVHSPVDEKRDCAIWLDEGVAINKLDAMPSMPTRTRKNKNLRR